MLRPPTLAPAHHRCSHKREVWRAARAVCAQLRGVWHGVLRVWAPLVRLRPQRSFSPLHPAGLVHLQPAWTPTVPLYGGLPGGNIAANTPLSRLTGVTDGQMEARTVPWGKLFWKSRRLSALLFRPAQATPLDRYNKQGYGTQWVKVGPWVEEQVRQVEATIEGWRLAMEASYQAAATPQEAAALLSAFTDRAIELVRGRGRCRR